MRLASPLAMYTYDAPALDQQARALDAMIRRCLDAQELLRARAGGGMERLSTLERETYESVERRLTQLRRQRPRFPHAPGY